MQDPIGEPCSSVDEYVEWLHGHVIEKGYTELAEIIARRMEENGLTVLLNDLRACDKFDIMDSLGDIDIPLF